MRQLPPSKRQRCDRSIATACGNSHVTEGDGSYVVKIILHGRIGELKLGQLSSNATMPPVGTQQALSDTEIAAVASYVRNAWGNHASSVTEEMVARQR